MTEVGSVCLAAALEYAALGWRVVPLHGVVDGKCTCSNTVCRTEQRSRGKHPRIKFWQEEATCDEEKIVDWFEKWPESNVGIQMGPASGIIDFETDSQEGEKLLAEIFGGTIPMVPMWSSGRGKHRLFQWRDDLPREATIPLGWGDVKLGSAGKGSQAVFPPSTHYSGQHYKWLISPSEATPAPVPDHVQVWLFNRGDETSGGKPRKSREHWQKLGSGVGEGLRNEASASMIGGILRNAQNIDDPAAIELLFQAACGINSANKPPLDDREIQATFESILRKERQRRATETADAVLARTPEERIAEATREGIKVPERMRLVIVDSDPPLYELYAPQFHKARSGCLRLNAQQLCSYGALKVQALEQAEYPLPAEFKKAWERKGGLYEQVIHSAEKRSAAAVERRLATIAEYLLGRISAATARADGKDEPDVRKPVKMKDGSVWFRWNETWRDGIFEGIVQREDPRRLANVLKLSESDFVRWPNHGDNRRRFCRLTPTRIKDLERIAELDAPIEPTVLGP